MGLTIFGYMKTLQVQRLQGEFFAILANDRQLKHPYNLHFDNLFLKLIELDTFVFGFDQFHHRLRSASKYFQSQQKQAYRYSNIILFLCIFTSAPGQGKNCIYGNSMAFALRIQRRML